MVETVFEILPAGLCGVNGFFTVPEHRYHCWMKRLLIRGDGVAAACCAHLLRKAGSAVSREPLERPRLPAIMLSEAAAAMIGDVFDCGELFGGLHAIRKRVVAWGGARPVTLGHSAVVVSERELLNRVREDGGRGNGGADWTVYTSRPLPAESAEHRFGTRLARALPVALRGGSDTCWIESLDEGWLFLIPNREGAGWLLAVGAEAEVLMAHSRLVSGQVAAIEGEAVAFPAYPRIVEPLCGDGWLACGSAAMAFDPLCGDGTANAVREAILACAVIGAGADTLTHYEARLIAGFQKHLALCMSFYESGGAGPWWESERAALLEGLEWCARRSAEFGPYRYRLQGYELVSGIR